MDAVTDTASAVFGASPDREHLAKALTEDYKLYGGGAASSAAWLDFPSADRKVGGSNFSDAGINMDVRFNAPFFFPKHHHEHAVLRTSQDGQHQFALQRGALLATQDQKPFDVEMMVRGYALQHKEGLPPFMGTACDAFLLVTLTAAGKTRGQVLVPADGKWQTIKMFGDPATETLVAMEVRPNGLSGAARLHGNLMDETADERCDVTLQVRAVWLPKDVIRRRTYGSAASVARAQAELVTQVETANAVLHAILGVATDDSDEASTIPATINRLVPSDISATRNKLASRLLERLREASAPGSTSTSTGTGTGSTLLAHKESVARVLDQVQKLFDAVVAVSHRRCVDIPKQLDETKMRLQSVLSCLETGLPATGWGVTGRAKITSADISAALATSGLGVDAFKRRAREHLEALDEATRVLSSTACAPPFKAPLKAKTNANAFLRSVDKIRVARSAPAPKKRLRPPTSIPRKKRRKIRCVKKKKCAAKKKCVAKKRKTGGSSGSHRRTKVPTTVARRRVATKKAARRVSAPHPQPNLFAATAASLKVASSLMSEHGTGSAASIFCSMASAADDASAACGEAMVEEARCPPPLQAGQLLVKEVGPASASLTTPATGGPVPLVARALGPDGELRPFKLAELATSRELVARVSSAADLAAALERMEKAMGAVPVLPVITARGNAVHGVAIQIASLVSSPPRRDDAAQCQQSLALLLGTLFGITSEDVFHVSKHPRNFPPADVCVACLDAPPDVRLNPCGHCVTCSSCWERSVRAGLGHRCFLCRQPVLSSSRAASVASTTSMMMIASSPFDKMKRLCGF